MRSFAIAGGDMATVLDTLACVMAADREVDAVNEDWHGRGRSWTDGLKPLGPVTLTLHFTRPEDQ